VNGENAPIHFGNLDLINNLSSFSLQHLNEKILMIYTPTNNGFFSFSFSFSKN